MNIWKKNSYVSSYFFFTCLFSRLEKGSFSNFCLSDLALLCSPVLATTLGSSWSSRKEKTPISKSPYTHTFIPFPILTIKTMAVIPWIQSVRAFKDFCCPDLNQVRSHLFMVPRALICSLSTRIWQLEGPVPQHLLLIPSHVMARSWERVSRSTSWCHLYSSAGVNWRDEGSGRLPVSVSKGKNSGHLWL